MRKILSICAVLFPLTLAAKDSSNSHDKDRAHIPKADGATVGAEEAAHSKTPDKPKKRKDAKPRTASEGKEGSGDPRDDSANRKNGSD